MKFVLSRYDNGNHVLTFEDKSLEETRGIVQMVWGSVPDNMNEDAPAGEEWKFSLGEGHWVLVTRSS